VMYIDQFAKENDFPLGRIFLQSMNFFKLYTAYCINQPIACVKLREIRQTNEEFAKFLNNCEQDPRCHGLLLNAFLIKPIQRICKYPLLLQDILQHTPPGHNDYRNLEESVTQIKAILGIINDRKREGEATSKMLAINDKLEGYHDLLRPFRKLIMDDLLVVGFKKRERPQEMRVVLFNDLLLIAREHRKTLEFRRALNLAQVEIVSSAEDSLTWELRDTTKKKRTIFTNKHEAETQRWVQTTRRYIRECSLNNVKLTKNTNRTSWCS